MTRLTFERVGYRPTPTTSPILGEVSFSLARGELVGLFGRNGAGKSTLARLAAGLVLPTSGRVEVAGLCTSTRDPEIQRRVGILFQEADRQIVGVTVEEDLAFGPENLGMEPALMRARVRATAERLGLGAWLRRPVAELSGGMRQKLALGGVLVMDPDFLLLDEPTSQLDPWARREFWDLLLEVRQERGLGILVVSPRPAETDRLERALVLDGGRLAFDGPLADLWALPESEVAAWGVRVPEGIRWQRLGLVSGMTSGLPPGLKQQDRPPGQDCQDQAGGGREATP